MAPFNKPKQENEVRRSGSEVENDTDVVWLKLGGIFLTELDKKLLIGYELLNDRHINLAQQVLHNQFPHVQGLGHT